MSKLNGDVLYLILKELNNDKNTLHSCLLVNKTWCETIIPILWRNPWKYLNFQKEKFLLDIIILHLSEESRNKLKNQSIDFSLNSYNKPLFNYINFCKHLNLNAIEKLVKDSKIQINYNDIICLFINENTKFTHLYIPRKFDYLIHHNFGAERCISEIEFLSCNTNINDNSLAGLTKLCKSIKELELIISEENNNHGITKLIEVQKSLINVRLLANYKNYNYYEAHDESSWKVLENSLIKHANTIQHFMTDKRPTTNILSYFKNLKSLELNGDNLDYCEKWNCLENLSLPFLQALKSKNVRFSNLTNLIENTNGYLTELSINNSIATNDIQTIYNKCPNLKYLKLPLRGNNFFELEKLLINCQYLDGLFIIGTFISDWKRCFEILAKSSPTNLFKFKFKSLINIEYEHLKLFFDNWRVRSPSHPMLLQLTSYHHSSSINMRNKDLIEKYKAEGIIKFVNHLCNEDFEWI
jgi:hypothetical protein